MPLTEDELASLIVGEKAVADVIKAIKVLEEKSMPIPTAPYSDILNAIEYMRNRIP